MTRIVVLGSRFSRYTHLTLAALERRGHPAHLLVERWRFDGDATRMDEAVDSAELVRPRRLLSPSAARAAVANPVLALRTLARVLGTTPSTTTSVSEAFDPDRLNTRAIGVRNYGSPATLRALREAAPDIILLAPAGEIVKRDLLDTAKLGVLNAHMGPLPEIRGMNALEWAVLLGERLEVTCHLVDEGLDTGATVCTRPLVPKGSETLASLRMRAISELAEALVDGIAPVSRGQRPFSRSAAHGPQYFRMHDRLRKTAERRLTGAVISRRSG